jgi:hypothetical protein
LNDYARETNFRCKRGAVIFLPSVARTVESSSGTICGMAGSFANSSNRAKTVLRVLMVAPEIVGCLTQEVLATERICSVANFAVKDGTILDWSPFG